MQVVKRNEKVESLSFDKITKRIEQLCKMKPSLDMMDPIQIAQLTIQGLYNKISTTEIDNLSANICASRLHQHPQFNQLASRICVSNLHKQTPTTLLEAVNQLYSHQLISDEYYNFVQANHVTLENMIDYTRDFLFDFFGIKTLERSYLLRTLQPNGKAHIIERPQHMWMRVAVQIHGLHPEHSSNVVKQLQKIKDTYDLMSKLKATHATPTLFNSGCRYNQLSSCFLLSSADDLKEIFNSVSNIAQISKLAGGIGIALSDLRAKGSIIKSTHGKAEGIIPCCKVLESVARYVTQSGKRLGSIAVYMEPWHADIFDFIDLRKNTGDENLRARDLFLALWVPDLFMKRVQENGMWSLMCPAECPGLTTSHSTAFEALYLQYESEKRYRKQIPAVQLWKHILEQQIEVGMPYLLFKDTANRRSNQQNLGTIKSSNLCAEIIEYSSTEEYGVCNLASLSLSSFVDTKNKTYDFKGLLKVAKQITENLDKVIDVNHYPVVQTSKSNNQHRPIGLGVQGLADVYNMLGMPFDSEEAQLLNKQIFATIYFAAISKSVERAEEIGSYGSFQNSPASQGCLQFDLEYGIEPMCIEGLFDLKDWNKLKERVKKHGLRNSLLTCVMPTASTSQILRNNECIEPFTTNVFVRKTLAGEYIIVNEHLVHDCIQLGIWNKELYHKILANNGSVQSIDEIPANLKAVYKTAYELKMVDILKQAIGRAPYIDQSQSMNLFMKTPDFSKLNSSHFYAWKHGLKTGMYYLRTQPAVDAIKFGLSTSSASTTLSSTSTSSPVSSLSVSKPKYEPFVPVCESCSG